MVYKKFGEENNKDQIIKSKNNLLNKNLGKNKEIIEELQRNRMLFEAINLSKEVRSNILKTHGNTHPDYDFFSRKMADLYKEIYRYDKSEKILLELNDLNRNKLEKKPLTYADGLRKLALIYKDKGRYEDAEKLLKEAEDIYLTRSNLKDLNLYSKEVKENPKEEYKDNLASYAIILNNLGKVLQEKGENREYMGDVAGAHEYYGNAEKAYRWSKRFLRHTVGDDDIRYGRNLKDLANIHGIIGNYEYAQSKMNKAYAIYKSHYPKEDPANFEVCHKLAWLEYRQGNYYSAGTKFINNKNRFKNILNEHPAYAQLLNNLAKTEVASSYKYRGKSEEDQRISDELMEDAYFLMKKAFEINNKILPQLLYMDSDKQRLRFLRSLDFNMHLFLTLVMERYNDILIPQARKDAFDFVLRRKSLTMEISHFLQESAILRETDDLFAALNNINFQISSLNIKKTDVGDSYSDTLKELESERSEIESQISSKIPEKELEIKLKQANLENLSKVLKPNSVLIEYVKFYPYNFKAKGKESSWKKPHYIAFSMHAGKPDDVKMIDLGKAEDIDARIIQFRESLNDYRNSLIKKHQVNEKLGSSLHKFSEKLREMIFDPLEIKKGQHLIISPDDALSTIPLEVLPLGLEYLIDHYVISYLGSSRDLMRIHDDYDPDAETVVIANPDYFLINKNENTKKGRIKTADNELKNHSIPLLEIGPFKSLKNNELEGEKVVGILKENGFKVNLFTKDQATESRIKNFDPPLILHMATHGFFAGEDNGNSPSKSFNPLVRSGLALAGANSYILFNELPDYPEDGILTALDVNGLNLAGTEMVVLSACETGMGKVERGEGVFGLRRSFNLAGAKTLVMSLWKVNDLATMILMEKFYQNLLSENMGRLSALRDAQKYLRDINIGELKSLFPEYNEIITEYFSQESEDRQPFSHPYFWGGFILQGETAPSIKDELKIIQ
jgi:CHAT domain-containing protein